MRFSVLAAALACGPLAFADDFEIKDQGQFKKIFPAGAKVTRLATDLQFIEGPAWLGGGLVFSDIPANKLMKWTPGGIAVFRNPSGNANGNTIDRQGRLVTCEHGGRRVSRLERDGKVVTVADSFQGKKLNSPNDVVVKSDDTIWFTDPDYGLDKRPKEQDGNYVFRYNEKSKALAVVASDFDKPNGLAFAPGEKKLYIADSGKPHHIRVFDVGRDGTVSNGRIFAVIEKGVPDGIRCDPSGRVWSSSGNGADVFAPDGSLIVKINLPEAAANLCFGGKDGTTLFLTAREGLYAVETKVRGAR